MYIYIGPMGSQSQGIIHFLVSSGEYFSVDQPLETFAWGYPVHQSSWMIMIEWIG